MRDPVANPAQTNDTDGLALQLPANLLLTIKKPPGFSQAFVDARQVAIERQHQRQGVLGSGNGTNTGDVHDEDAALCSEFDIDASQSGGHARDQLQMGRMFQQRRIQLEIGAGDNGCRFAQGGADTGCLGRHDLDAEIVVCLKQGDALLCQVSGDENTLLAQAKRPFDLNSRKMSNKLSYSLSLIPAKSSSWECERSGTV